MRKVYLSFCVVLCAVLLITALSGCRTSPKPAKEDDALSWAQEPEAPPSNGSIYQVGRDVALFENPIARHVGDIVTIVLSEATAAKKSATTNTAKATTDTLPGMTLLGAAATLHGRPLLNNDINDAAKFSGSADSAQSNSLTGFLTVTVVRVLPNGNLFVKGEKYIELNQGSELMRLTGVVRPIDLAPDNSIPSLKVGAAKISYVGKGALADANAQGWLSRFFNSPWTPF